MNEELKKLLDQLNRAFEDFKSSNDERLKQIETRGHASADVVQNVEKANTAISALTTQIKEIRDALREVENAQARILPSGARALSDEMRAHVRTFVARSNRVPVASIAEVTDAHVESFRAYNRAFDAYLRVGENGLSTDMRAALQTGSENDGGWMISPDRTARIVTQIVDESNILSLVSSTSTSKDQIEGQLFFDEEIESGWVGETEARPNTGQVKGPGEYAIPVYEMYANPKATQKMLDDADRDVGAWLEAALVKRLGRVKSRGVYSGTGIKQMKGFLGYATVGNKPVAGAGAAGWQRIEALKTGVNADFAATNPGDIFIDLITALHPNYRNAASFLTNRLTVAKIRKFKDGQGNYLWQPDFTKGPAGSILDYGITEDEYMPALANGSISLGFGDWKSLYTVVNHSTGLRTLRDPFTAKPWVQFYTTERVGGDVVDPQAAKLLVFST